MVDRSEHQNRPGSFYASPAEAGEAPPEELLYVACLHRGTGVDAPDFLAVVDADGQHHGAHRARDADAERRRRAASLRLESVQLGVSRAGPIPPDRARLLLLADPRRQRRDDPRRPRIDKVIEPEELGQKTGYSRPHTVHCMPGDNVVVSMLGDREGGGAGGFAVLTHGRSRSRAAGRPAAARPR